MERLPNVLKDQVRDFAIGDRKHWKSMFGACLSGITAGICGFCHSDTDCPDCQSMRQFMHDRLGVTSRAGEPTPSRVVSDLIFHALRDSIRRGKKRDRERMEQYAATVHAAELCAAKPSWKDL